IYVGGLGASFLNAVLIVLFNFFLVKLFKVKINGIVIAAFFTLFGFSFFGKNMLNILPFYLGGLIYTIYTSTEFSENLIGIAFSSALAPFVSAVAFNDSSNYETSYIKAILIGVLIGFIVIPLAKSLYNFHNGYDLYNLGFTAGILGAVIVAILKIYNFEIHQQYLISTTFDLPIKIICSVCFLSLIIIGFFINENSFSGYFELIKDDGYNSDFTEIYGYGLSYINMGIMGFIGIAFVFLTGQTFNGPILAGLFTLVGFAANGKTIFNTIPILIGVFLAKSTSDISTFSLALSGLFSTSLAPICGTFGPIAGVIAGGIHLAIVQNIGLVHGGLNLYNNGFAAGIVAAFLFPIFDMISDSNAQKKINIQKKHMMFLKNMKKEIQKRNEEKENIE
ncbi:MAG: DUF1576 domain-containing protein, partial [Fusobacterium sp.]|nr:DUF1576 domain-containing protein [Fusobacterium sp.]